MRHGLAGWLFTAVVTAGPVFAHGDCVERAMQATVQVNDRCRRDADLRRYLVAGMVIRRNLSMFEQRNVPEFLPCVRIECVYAGMLRGYVKYIAQSLARDFSPSGIKGLSIYFPIDMNDEQLPKCPGIYVL